MNNIVKRLNDTYVKIKIVPDLVNEAKDEIINKENPEYNQDFTDNVYDQLVLSKKDVQELLPIIKTTDNISSETRAKYLTDYQNLLNDINENIEDIKAFVSNKKLAEINSDNTYMSMDGGKRKRKSKRKTKAKSKSHKRRRTNKRKSNAKRKSKRK